MLNTTATTPTHDRRPTAKLLGDFRRELHNEGIDDEIADRLVEYAGQNLIDAGALVVTESAAGGAS